MSGAKTAGLAVLSAVLLLSQTACGNLGYYFGALAGHAELLNAQRPLDEVLADPAVDAETRARLKTLQQAREFASRELGLPDNDSYRGYADLGRDYAVWNVIATPPFSLEPKRWCFLFVGCLSYRGYYRRAQAEARADSLRAEGLDVQVAGARAYSTLGWTDDPLLNTMLYASGARRAGLLFHELAHQQLFVKGDTTFNESFATTVEEEGVRRWLRSRGRQEEYRAWRAARARDTRFRQLLLQTRARLQALYRQRLAPAHMRERKARIFADLKQRFAALKQREPAFADYAAWMAQDLNNAHLALLAAYHEYVPGFRRLLAQQGGDLRAFYRAAQALAAQPEKIRRARLLALAGEDHAF